MLYPVRNDPESKHFNPALSLVDRLPVSHNAGEFQNLSQPSTIRFAFNLNA